MNLTYTVAGLVIFIFALGVTMWSHGILSEYAGIIGKIDLAVTSLADQSIPQQYQLAQM